VPVTPEQLAQLIDRHAAALVLLARTRCNCAEDVVQEALIALAAAEPPPDEPAAWLFVAVRRRAVSAARAAARRRKHEANAVIERQAWFTSTSNDRLDAEAVARQMANLDETEREIVVLRLWGGLTFRQIAAVTELSTSTAQRHYEAALEQLRTSLKHPCPTKTIAR
jgi:RNA polymerase sigma-70 factor (ECF subfamily)